MIPFLLSRFTCCRSFRGSFHAVDEGVEQLDDRRDDYSAPGYLDRYGHLASDYCSRIHLT